MEITRTVNGETLEVAVEGRLDGYWADHLDGVLTESVRDGHHRIRLDCSKLSFLSSAGIAILVKFHQQLARISGSFQVVNPSKPVSLSLGITKLTGLLVEAPAAAPAGPLAITCRLERDGAGFDVHKLDTKASLTCRATGSDAPLVSGGFGEKDCYSLEARTPMFAVGVGAFGGGFAECRSRFGELLSVGGATAYQPADGTNVPDYLVATGALAADIRVLYCLSCEGAFSHLVRFEARERGGTVGLSRVLDACLEAAEAPAIGIVIVAETVGLVGAALRRSPADAGTTAGADFFTHPDVSTRLTFTAEPAFARGVALAAGVVTRANGGVALPFVRPIGGDCVGHLHAAAFHFRPIRKGAVGFQETVSSLFEADQLLGVLHLLHDDRGPSGAGESEFVRGACWIGPCSS